MSVSLISYSLDLNLFSAHIYLYLLAYVILFLTDVASDY